MSNLTSSVYLRSQIPYVTHPVEADGVRDFAFAYDSGNGSYHIYYIHRENKLGWTAAEGTATGFGYQYSYDLTTGWTYDSNISFTGGSFGGWIEDRQFAPQLVKYDDIWWMFLCGLSGVVIPVTSNPPDAQSAHTESIGVFSSLTLGTSWNPATTVDSGFLIDSSTAAWSSFATNPSGAWTKDCRDPCVVRDFDTGNWYMFASARSGDTDSSDFMVLGVASSTTINGTYSWLDSPVFTDQGIVLSGGFVESPYVMKYAPSLDSDVGAFWYMFVYQGGFKIYTSSTIEGQWTYINDGVSVKPDVSPQYNCNDPFGSSRIANEVLLYQPLPANPNQNRRYITGFVYDSGSIERIEFYEFDPKTALLGPFLL